MPFYDAGLNRKAANAGCPPKNNLPATRSALTTRSLDLADMDPVPLEEAADQLEMSPQDLLARFKNGEFQGFLDGGQIYVYIPERLANGKPSDSAEDTVIEYQRIEINRLLKAIRELKEEKDRLYGMLEREQALRHGLQQTMERLNSRAALPMPGRQLKTIERYASPPPQPVLSEQHIDIESYLPQKD